MKDTLAELKPVYRLYMDGDMWCAVGNDFVNMVESPIGFGSTPGEAIDCMLTAMYLDIVNKIKNRFLNILGLGKEWLNNSFLLSFFGE